MQKKIMKKGYLLAAMVTAFTGSSMAAVQPLSVHGNQIFAGDHVSSFAGNSLFWTNDGWGGEKFYTNKTVFSLKKHWHAGIVRAAMGVEDGGGYLQDPEGNRKRVETVVNAAIYNNMYAIIDFHSSHAENYQSQAIEFFKAMAIKYGKYPNVIFEIYNEPLGVSWSGVIKPYATNVIAEIRKYAPNNLIVVGTPSWSQNVDEASRDPLNGKNIAYTLHFYAATHGEDLRNKARTALKNGIPLFVTEWGAVEASGGGNVNQAETENWINFMKENNISNCNWSYNDKPEGASTFNPGSYTLTPSGQVAFKNVSTWPNKP